MGSNVYQDTFGKKHNNSPNFFSKMLHYGVGAARVISSVGEGLAGNPMGFVNAAEQFGNLVKDKVDGKMGGRL